MKNFEPHAILRSPLTSDETVEALINLISSNEEPLVLLLIDPPLSPTRKDEPSSHASWPVFEKPA